MGKDLSPANQNKISKIIEQWEWPLGITDKNGSFTCDYEKSKFSLHVVGATDELISSLVKARNQFIIINDNKKADAICEGLSKKYNVLINDRLKQWSVGGEFGEENDSEGRIGAEMDSHSNASKTKINSETNLNSLTVPELKEKLRAAHLPVSGRKSELIERLIRQQ